MFRSAFCPPAQPSCATPLELHFPHTLHAAAGPPQDEVAACWPEQPYYEWWGAQDDGTCKGKDATLTFLRDFGRG